MAASTCSPARPSGPGDSSRDSRLGLYLNTQDLTAMDSPPRDLDAQWRLLLEPMEHFQATLLRGYRDLEQQVASLRAELTQTRAQRDTISAACQQLQCSTHERDRVIAAQKNTMTRQAAALQGGNQALTTYARAQFNAAYLQLQQDVLAKDQIIADLQQTVAALQAPSVEIDTAGLKAAWNELGNDKECSICLVDLMQTQYDVLQCVNGHAICSGCFDQLPAGDGVCCPTCRADGPLVKNVLMSRLRSALWAGPDTGGGVEFNQNLQQCGEKGCFAMVKIGKYQGFPEFFRCPLHRPSNEGLPCQRIVNGVRCGKPGTKESRGYKSYCCEHFHGHARKFMATE